MTQDLQQCADMPFYGMAGAALDAAGCYRLPRPGETMAWAVGVGVQVRYYSTEITVRAADKDEARRLARDIAKEEWRDIVDGIASVDVSTDSVRPGNPAGVWGEAG